MKNVADRSEKPAPKGRKKKAARHESAAADGDPGGDAPRGGGR